MLIFGSIGIFVKYIPLSSELIALTRAMVGVLFLLTVILLRKKPIALKAIKKNLVVLSISGVAIGFNWILLFESYHYTSVAVSTLCYYMAPIIVIILSPIFLKEKLTLKKGLCVAAALAGMVLISVTGVSENTSGDITLGILLGLGAAVLYASVILLNKFLKDIDAFDKTIMQLFVAALVLVPYNLWTIDFSEISLSATTIVLLLFVGIIHTGFAYYLYFGSMRFLSGQSIAIFSYIDPVVAVLASVVLLGEPFTIVNAVGAALIIGSALLSELNFHRRNPHD